MQSMRKRLMSMRLRFKILILQQEKLTTTGMLRQNQLCNTKQTFKRWKDSYPSYSPHTTRIRPSGRVNASSLKIRKKITRKTSPNPKESSKSPWSNSKREALQPKTNTNSIKTPSQRLSKTNTNLKSKKC